MLLFLKKFYYIVFLILSIIVLILSFFPILFNYVVIISSIFIFIELLRLGYLKNTILWLLKKQKRNWNVNESKIILFSIISILVSFINFIILFFISMFFYILPLKKEFINILK